MMISILKKQKQKQILTWLGTKEEIPDAKYILMIVKQKMLSVF